MEQRKTRRLFDIGSVLGVAVLRIRSPRLLDDRTVEDHMAELHSGQFVEAPLILDLVNVQQWSSVFARRLTKFAKRRLRAGFQTVIYMANPQIREQLRLLDRKGLLPVFDTYTEALSSMGKIDGPARSTRWFSILRNFWSLYYRPAAAYLFISMLAVWAVSTFARAAPPMWAMGQ